jgi:predicted secreted acid phosphatase
MVLLAAWLAALSCAAPALAEFGRRYFIIPNPMYGSWERL